MATILERTLNLNTLARKIEAATDRNDHTGARVMLAGQLGGKFPALMKAIETIHDIEGCMPYEVGQYRTALTKEMIADAERQWGDAAAAMIKSAF